MSNPRDTGRYDATTSTWHSENIRVDFAWGNMPMQPDDDRMVGLDPELDSHIIATSEYQGFPAFITGAPYDDTIDNAIVPNLVGLEDPTAAQAALADAGLVLGNTNSSTAGANSSNDGTVKSQSLAAGTAVNEGATVDIVVYDYVVPVPVTTGPISGFNRASGIFNSGLNGDDAIMYLFGQTVKPTVGWTISVTGASNSTYNRNWTVVEVKNDNSYNTNGTAVKITKASGDMFLGGNASGGTWTKAGFNSADYTLTSAGVGFDSGTQQWGFYKPAHTVAVGDWVRASGFFVIDQNGNRTPSGSIDVNGDWQIDALFGDYFSSAALRTEIGNLIFFNASSIGQGTVQVDSQ